MTIRKNTLILNGPQYDALLAGVRLLAAALTAGEIKPDDGDVGDILTNSGEHPGLTASEVYDLGDAMQAGDLDPAAPPRKFAPTPPVYSFAPVKGYSTPVVRVSWLGAVIATLSFTPEGQPITRPRRSHLTRWTARGRLGKPPSAPLSRYPCHGSPSL